ncbi:hypothetical protein DH2020_022321 [Rehmannia glutinosa]|uniref:Glycosyltransferase n=1 Tax=Rehmannia glutinosa TaxID=99300 RepID=A0ABR0WFX2_REHGL
MEQESFPSHVVVFPFPVQSHVNVMLNLAEIFSLSGFQVTFLIPDHIRKGPRFDQISSRFTRYPGFIFKTISDGLSVNHPRTGDRVKELFDSINATTRPLFRIILKSRSLICNGRAPLTCIVADGIMSFAIDIAKDFDLPTILFRPFSATCFWTLFCVPKLIQAGELPLKGVIFVTILFCIYGLSSSNYAWDSDMEKLVENVPGMEGVLRLRDLPSFCRVEDVSNPQLQHVVSETHRATNAYGLILNTFEDLEESALAHIRANIPKLYVIGPLHGYLRPLQGSKSLSEEDRKCIEWLDDQPLRSVVFVSFGNMTVLNIHQLMEFWHGLLNSGKPFLWVISGNLTTGKCHFPADGSVKKGKVVDWAPQEEILSHPATGGFLTHCGWNSTLESVCEGVPMICWPFYADQQVNSRLVEEVWRVGVDMKDICDRRMVEKMVRELMEVRREEFVKSAQEMARLARKSVSEGGASSVSLDSLVRDIKVMSHGKST